MLKGVFKSDEQVAEEKRAAEEADSELDARREAAYQEQRETPWIVKQDVRGHWGVHRKSVNWYNGSICIDGLPIATFPTVDDALGGVHRLASPEIIHINRDGTIKEQADA